MLSLSAIALAAVVGTFSGCEPRLDPAGTEVLAVNGQLAPWGEERATKELADEVWALGMRAYRDIATGSLREPSAEEATAEQANRKEGRLAAAGRVATEEPQELPSIVPGGGVRVRLGARYHTELRAIRGPDCRVELVEGPVARSAAP